MSPNDLLKPPKIPCGTCPYRKDVPSGIWHQTEYAKLPPYDLPTINQPFGLFMCHQKDGCICGGWLMTHDRDELLALRLNANHLDDSVWTYAPNVEVFESGLMAAEHGMKEIEQPNPQAKRKIAGLIRKKVADASG